MKALTFKRYGKSPEIGFADVPRPAPKPDELLVQVHAAGLNPIDNVIPQGIFKPVLHFQLPATLGSDLAGVVVEVGSRVTRFKPGDAVFASLFDLGNGSLAEFAVVPESASGVEAVQPGLRAGSVGADGRAHLLASAEGACQSSAWSKVFIPAGSGGIGTFAIQLAKHLGAKVGTTVSTGNVELVRSLGADEIVDYKKQEFEKVLRGYDAVLGTVKGDAVEKSIGILKPGSKIVSLIGPLDAAFARAKRLNFILTFVFGLMSRKILRLARKRDVNYSFLFVHPDGHQLAAVGDLLESERIRPVIDKVFPFEQAKEALDYLALGTRQGQGRRPHAVNRCAFATAPSFCRAQPSAAGRFPSPTTGVLTNHDSEASPPSMKAEIGARCEAAHWAIEVVFRVKARPRRLTGSPPGWLEPPTVARRGPLVWAGLQHER